MNSRHHRVIVDLKAIQHNYLSLKKQSNNTRCIAVIKANAYGHGAIKVAQALSTPQVMADAFAVATVQEGVQLRDAGIEQKIIVLGGFVNELELKQAVELKLDSVVHSEYQVVLLTQSIKPISLWVKVNSGMGRLGFSIDDINSVLQRLEAYQSINFITHLANADNLNSDKTNQQLALIERLKLSENEWSIANSAGSMGWLQSHKQWNRLGIALYGINPFSSADSKASSLKPAMRFESQLVALYQRKKGEDIGYGATYQCESDMLVGIVGAGYGDGYPRLNQGKGMVSINGQLAPIIGRISMDMITVNLNAINQPKIGDSVILWGSNQLKAESVADNANTIAYEICCNAGAHGQIEYEGL